MFTIQQIMLAMSVALILILYIVGYVSIEVDSKRQEARTKELKAQAEKGTLFIRKIEDLKI